MFEKLEDWPKYKAFFDDIQSNWQVFAEDAKRMYEKQYVEMWREQGLHNQKWKVFGFYFKDEECYMGIWALKSWKILVKHKDIIQNCGFSFLEPGCEIIPHVGYTSDVLRCHLGLVVPDEYDKCGIQVGDEVRHWKEGELMLFDDTIRHSAWNRSEQHRIVLLTDLYR